MGDLGLGRAISFLLGLSLIIIFAVGVACFGIGRLRGYQVGQIDAAKGIQKYRMVTNQVEQIEEIKK